MLVAERYDVCTSAAVDVPEQPRVLCRAPAARLICKIVDNRLRRIEPAVGAPERDGASSAASTVPDCRTNAPVGSNGLDTSTSTIGLRCHLRTFVLEIIANGLAQFEHAVRIPVPAGVFMRGSLVKGYRKSGPGPFRAVKSSAKHRTRL